MLDERRRRDYSPSTVRSHFYAAKDFAKYFRRSPERLGPEQIRQYQKYLLRILDLGLFGNRRRSAALERCRGLFGMAAWADPPKQTSLRCSACPFISP
jgi:hypothetical protein